LSYSTFEYSELKISEKEFDTARPIQIHVSVLNTGKYAGAEVVQLYLSDIVASARVPNLSLEGFEKITLQPGEKKEVIFELDPEQLAIINDRGEKIIEPGSFNIYVGGKQPNMKGNADNPTTQVLSEIIKYTGPYLTL
jgi:beta-glucosidase